MRPIPMIVLVLLMALGTPAQASDIEDKLKQAERKLKGEPANPATPTGTTPTAAARGRSGSPISCGGARRPFAARASSTRRPS